MPVRPARVGRVGVIGAPVAKTAVVAKAVTPGPVTGREDRGCRRGRHAWTPPANLRRTRPISRVSAEGQPERSARRPGGALRLGRERGPVPAWGPTPR